MTTKQYNELCVGDMVTTYGGPNKDIKMIVKSKYLGSSGTLCLSAEGIEPNSVYNQNRMHRNDNYTCGSFSRFKVIK